MLFYVIFNSNSVTRGLFAKEHNFRANRFVYAADKERRKQQQLSCNLDIVTINIHEIKKKNILTHYVTATALLLQWLDILRNLSLRSCTS
jgi:hypothetical protein